MAEAELLLAPLPLEFADMAHEQEDSPSFTFGMPMGDRELFEFAAADGGSGDDGSASPRSFSTPSPELGPQSALVGHSPLQPQTISPAALFASAAPAPAVTATTPAASAAPVAAAAAAKEGAPRRKRRRAEDSPAAEAAAAELAAQIGTDTDLLALTTEEIEALISARKASATLDPEQERRLRKIRRLIKNREYAQSSRDKRKQAVGVMERELAALREENRVLRDKLAALTARNAALELENSRLRKLSTTAAAATTASSVGIATAPPPLHRQDEPSLTRRSVSGSGSGVNVARSACLLAVCLVGLGLFLAIAFPQQTAVVGEAGGVAGTGAAAGRTLKSTAESRGASSSFLWALPRYFSLHKIFGAGGGGGGGGGVQDRGKGLAAPPEMSGAEYGEWLGSENGVAAVSAADTMICNAATEPIAAENEENASICEWPDQV